MKSVDGRGRVAVKGMREVSQKIVSEAEQIITF